MLFKYKGINKEGFKVKSRIEANSLLEAKSKLKSKGILYTSISNVKFPIFLSIFKRRKNISKLLLSNFSRDLQMYLEAGMSLVSSINLLQKRYIEDKNMYLFLETVYIYLDEGKTFYYALENQKVFKIPEFFNQSIKVSEDSGVLESVLLELSIFLKEQDKVEKQMSNALIYPFFVLSVSFLIVIFMATFVVPKFTAIFMQLNQELPASTEFLINLGEFFLNNYLNIIILIVVLISLYLYLSRSSLAFVYFVDKIKLKIPFFSKLIEQDELSRFAYMNSILIKSGFPIAQSINLSSNILKNSVIRKIFIDASKSIVEGKKLSTLLHQNKRHKIDESFIHSIAIGEDTSNFSNILNNLAKIYTVSNKDKREVLLSLLEPIFMLIVGSIIGFIVISMLLPIFSINLG